MVLKPNYQPERQANMQYPPAGSSQQGRPYGEGNQQQNINQSQGYIPQNSVPYPPQSPAMPNPYSVSRGENSGYYEASQRPPSYSASQPPAAPYQQQSSPYGNAYDQQEQYPPTQYNPHQQYSPPAQGPYGGPPPPLDSKPNYQHQGAYTPTSQPQGVYPPFSQSQGGYPPVSQPQGGYPPEAQSQTDEERGVMGALAGGAAGGFAGHKMHHGIIGTLGGAYAGHKIEDELKKHHNRPPSAAAQQPIPPLGPPSSHNSQGTHHGAQMLGNFSQSSTKISLDNDYDLIAECKSVNGDQKLTSISLNQVLTNEDGQFKWVDQGGNFGGSARNVQLVENGRVLQAELCRCDGSWNMDKIMLDERIENNDGNLMMK